MGWNDDKTDFITGRYVGEGVNIQTGNTRPLGYILELSTNS